MKITDALWLSALARDRGRALRRLAEVLPGRDVGEAAPLAARLVHAELDREVRAGRPVERTGDRLRRAEVERRVQLRGWVHPGWERIRRGSRRAMARGPVIRGPSPWDAAAGRAMALRLPATVWGSREGQRPEPGVGAHQLAIRGYDVAAELGPWVEETPLDAASWEVEPWIVRAIHGDHRHREGHFGVVDME